MFLCPKCDYVYDIQKNKKIGEEKIKVNKINNIFKLLDKNLDAYKLTFPPSKLKKSKKFQKLEKNIQTKILNMYNNKKKVLIGAEFICSNCNNIEPITTSVKLYEIRKDKEIQKKLNKYDLEFYISDPLNPRTKDYNCKNANCITHKNESLKEAIFFKNNDSYKLTYVCTVCSYLW